MNPWPAYAATSCVANKAAAYVCRARMQAVGMVNDHTVDCFRWRELGGGA
jgi:3-methyladenine DNA glycosylase Tag